MPDLMNDGHEPLGSNGAWNPPVTYQVILGMNRGTARKLLFTKPKDTEIVTSQTPSRPSGIMLTRHNPTRLLDVIIENDCFIELWLSDKIDWFWRPKNAITTSLPVGGNYFNLQYADLAANTWATVPDQNSKYYGVRFGVKKRTQQVFDSINFNIVLEYPGGDVLPISVDPDIQNPGVR
jgi:hypothetical protein